MLESILALGQDIFTYNELLNGIEAKGKKLSRTQKYKICAVFAQTCDRIPILKYESMVTWGTDVFGARAEYESRSKEKIFTKPISINKVLCNVNPDNWSSNYELSDLADPILFKEFQGVIASLTPSEVTWLATHRTIRNTQLCVLKDFNLWRFHLERIFERLLDPNNNVKKIDESKVTFFESEIKQATEDIEQVLKKIRNRNRYRLELKEKLVSLSATYCVAANIASSIDNTREISPQLVLKNEARRTLTNILELCLGIPKAAGNNQEIMNNLTIAGHALHLRVKLRYLPIRSGILLEKLKNAAKKNDTNETIKIVFELFRIFSEPDNDDLWTSKSIRLEKWM